MFSLEFPAIGLSVSGEARRKVSPHGKGYVWVSILGSFEKIQEVGVFSYLFYYLTKCHFNGWGFVKAWMAVVSVPKYLDRVKKSIEWFWTVHGLLCGLWVVVCYFHE